MLILNSEKSISDTLIPIPRNRCNGHGARLSLAAPAKNCGARKCRTPTNYFNKASEEFDDRLKWHFAKMLFVHLLQLEQRIAAPENAEAMVHRVDVYFAR